MEQRVRQVLIVLPGAMTVRNWLSTDVAQRLGREKGLCVTLVTADAPDAQAARAAGLAWQPMVRGRGSRLGPRLRLLAGYIVHQAIVFRFNALAGFRGAEQRLMQSWRLRKIAIKDGVPASRWFGRPFPQSRRVQDRLRRVYYSAWQRHASVERLFDEIKPGLLVLGHVQTHFATPYALAASARGIPMLGAIGSWDQPTTKGPLVPGVHRLLAQSRAVADDLVRYHAVRPEAVDVIGWVQMDLYFQDGFAMSRADTLADLGLPAQARYILVGASPERLGHNEPEICSRLAETLADRPDCAIVIRCHPNDGKWQQRFMAQHRPPRVVVLPPELDRMDRMANQIRHANAVLSPAGSILLDAVGLDTPAIALAFENDDEPHYDRLARRYDMEHLRSLTETGGVVLARNDADLLAHVLESLADRDRNSANRACLRALHLDPLDGRAAERLVAAIVREAGTTRVSQAYAAGAL